MALGLNTSVAPDWARKWAERLNITITNLTSPRTKFVATTADLPDAREWNLRQIWIEDFSAGAGKLVISNGVDWIRTDNGVVV